MVSSINIFNKIRVLSKISQPLATPSPSSPPHATRGLIIAVDGGPDAAIHQLTSYVADALRSAPVHARVRIWMPPTLAAHAARPSLSSYLQLITQWHEIAREVVAHVTTPPRAISPSPISPKTVATSTTAMDPNSPSPSIATAVSPTLAPKQDPPPDDDDSTPTLPIAILPRFQLTLTDAAASRIPIADAYAPVDHWQWMATLWRGIVGPDLIVAARPASPDAAAASPGGLTSAVPGSVEVRLADLRALVVTVPEGGVVPESALRRVGFEVGEWLRGWEGREREG